MSPLLRRAGSIANLRLRLRRALAAHRLRVASRHPIRRPQAHRVAGVSAAATWSSIAPRSAVINLNTRINHTVLCDSSQFIANIILLFLAGGGSSGHVSMPSAQEWSRMVNADRKILCIEDERETAGLIAEELVDRGFEVAVAYSGQEGLMAIMRATPDLVLCDVSMPTMTGFEVLERLNEIAPHLGRIPFVF